MSCFIESAASINFISRLIPIFSQRNYDVVSEEISITRRRVVSICKTRHSNRIQFQVMGCCQKYCSGHDARKINFWRKNLSFKMSKKRWNSSLARLLRCLSCTIAGECLIFTSPRERKKLRPQLSDIKNATKITSHHANYKDFRACEFRR